MNCSVSNITNYNVTVAAKGNSVSKNVSKEIAFFSNFLVYQSSNLYNVTIFAVNNQGNSESVSKQLVSTCCVSIESVL